MNISLSAILIIIAVLALMDALILSATITTKIQSRKRSRIRSILHKKISRALSSGSIRENSIPRKDRITFLILWYEATCSIEIPRKLGDQIKALSQQWAIGDSIGKLLRSVSWKRRAKGLILVNFLDNPRKKQILQRFLQQERTMLLRIKAVDTFCQEDLLDSIDLILKSMKGAGEVYREKVFQILSQKIDILQDWAEQHKDSRDRNVLRLLVRAAKFKRKDWYFSFLMRMIYSEQEDIRMDAEEILFQRYASELNYPLLMESGYASTRRKAVCSLIRTFPLPREDETSSWLEKTDLHDEVIRALRKKLQDNPPSIIELFERYKNAKGENVRLGYAEILSSRMPYFIRKLDEEENSSARKLIDDAITLHLSSDIIDFLNKNKNDSLEAKLIRIISLHFQRNPYFLQQCQMYLNAPIRHRWNIPEPSQYKGEPKIQLNGKDRRYLMGMMLFVFFLPAVLYLILHYPAFPYMTGEETVVSFLFHFHYLFAYYTIAVNSIYLLLMLLSWYAFNQQHSSWSVADKKLLFTPGVLPSTSILAPAYNEEKTIIDSVYSLLSLEYPDLEVIVINDGSRDKTAARLIKHFKMDLEDYPLSGRIETAPVSGVYRNKKIPNLILIDKKNGGKADSLNAGLNLASGEYICSIDADSLLEPDSLTKLMFRTLTNKKKTIAVGGNIIPVNGSKVDNGYIEEIHLPANRLARYQTIEYLRSFIAGRLGWAQLSSLLIISGAFGAFDRRYIQSIGGYMTGKGSLKKDTVGEDMELVVRLIHFLSEQKLSFKVDYAHNANCWTEVPEDLASLIKQRDRWHRGLIEIMVYHKRMLLKKRYGPAGLIAFPYFYLFELWGPFWEVQGYFVLLVSILLGLLSSRIFLFMFGIVVLYGILISSTAFFLAEKQVLYFKGREFFSGISLTFWENFGYRQFMSAIRPFCYIAYLFRNKDWQKLDRKGFLLHIPSNDEAPHETG